MKAILLVSILAIFLVACSQVQTAQTQDATSIQIADASKDVSVSENDVRIASDGFDMDSITIKKGQVLTLINDQVEPHIISKGGYMVSEGNLTVGERIDIPFNKEGRFLITDETVGSTLEVLVQ